MIGEDELRAKKENTELTSCNQPLSLPFETEKRLRKIGSRDLLTIHTSLLYNLLFVSHNFCLTLAKKRTKRDKHYTEFTQVIFIF